MNQKIITKILAIMILITIFSANISFLGEVFATNVNLENQSTLTNNASVNFDAYFKDENGNKVHTIKANMENKLILYLYGKVTEGYLKDIQVTINNANFNILEDEIKYGDIEDVSGNKVTINRIRRDEELEVAIPVQAIKDDEISLDMFNKQNEISMQAVLVRNNSKTRKISKTINTIVEWNGKAEATLNQEVIKYIPFENEDTKGIVLQTSIKTGLKENSLPIKNTEIIASVPTINGILPENIYVFANNTIATNGKDGLEFNNSNWNKNENTITINVENTSNDNKVIWKKNCQDEYILTFIYGEKAYDFMEETNTKVQLKANARIEAYNNEKTVVEKEEKNEIELTTQINNIVETIIKSNSQINKGHMYTKFDTEYQEKLVLDIANNKLANSIVIKEEKSQFIAESNQYDTNAVYKETKINKANFENILGNDGYIKLYNDDNKLIAIIDKNLEADKNNNYIIKYDTEIEKLKIETSEIKTVGKLILENSKVIPVIENETEVKDFKQIKTSIIETIINNEKEISTKTKEYTENLLEPTTQIETNISNKRLSTLVENENIDIMVVLKNSEIQCKLFKNPIIKIKLPEYVENIKLNNTTKNLFTDELNIKNTVYDEKTKTITIELEGNQTKYNDIAVTEGTIVTLNANITLNEQTPAIQDKIITTVINGEDTINAETIINYIIPNKDNEEETNISENTENETIQNQEQNNTIKNENEGKSEQINSEKNNIIEENSANSNEDIKENVKQKADIKVLIQTDLKDTKEVKEGQVINYTVTVVNMEKTTLNNVVIESNVPQGTTYREFVTGGNYSYDEYITSDKTVCTKTIDVLKPGERETLEYQVIVNEKQNNIDKISTQAIAKIEGYEDTLSEKIESQIIDGGIHIDLITKAPSTERYTAGTDITYIAYIQNVKSVDMKNIKALCKVPDGITFKDAYFAVKFDNDGKTVEYDKENNTIIWSLEKLEAGTRAEIQLVGTVNNNITEIKNQFEVQCSGMSKVYSNEVIRYINKASLSISQYSNINDTYINVGDVLQYYITVKNEGTKTAENVSIVNTLPDGMEKVTLKYKNRMDESQEVECQNKEITLSGFEIAAGDTLNITITAKVSELQNSAKGTITYTNKVKVSADEIDTIEANEIVHKIKVKNQNNDNERDKTYQISGVAWLDTSRDGKRDDDEALLKDIQVRLITKDEKTIATTKTNKKGEYTFENVQKGEYLIIFIYDTTKYQMTKYQVKDVVEAKNSDVAIEKDDFIDGNMTRFGITDVISIEDSNIYNIDIGLQDKMVFDLSLTKAISKVTIKNSSEMKSYNYNNKTLAKVEIASKDVNDTTAIIEYTIIIKNEGNLAGYAKSIVDYLPNDLKFSSELNKDWYVGKNGNLYNNSLANIQIQPGESKEIKLVVTKTMNDKNLGTINNSAEIAESYNDYGIEDIDSVAGNKSSKEDDYGSADMLISLNTGTIVMYTGLGITMFAIIVVAVYMIKKKILIDF